MMEKVRQWSTLRGLGNDLSIDKSLQMAFQRVQQEVTEIHESIVIEDWEEFQDAIGDTIITLINLAKIKQFDAEKCLDKAFDVIELRKGLTRDAGDFVRYDKLSDEQKVICDIQQGSPGDEYFYRHKLKTLMTKDFKA